MGITQKSSLIIFLNEISSLHYSMVGGKAKNLSILLEKGFPVPEGYCIITKAFEKFLNSVPDLSESFKKLETVSAENIEGIKREALIIRELLAEAPMPDDVEMEILSAWSRLGEMGSYAVRSSATAEDLEEASFAGQQDTYLDVKGKTAILGSVRNCWISMFNDRAVSYRLHKNIDSKKALMAVVIQRMVHADYSGVLFTVNPVNGNRNQMVIEYTQGLGEGLVSGRVTPDNKIINKDKLMLISSSKKEESDQFDKLYKEVSRLAKRIEMCFGSPQDIEWAIHKGKVYILQSRPITTLQEEKDKTVWSNVNVGEIMPSVITPMFYTYFQNMAKAIFKPALKFLGIKLDNEPIFGLIAGRVYVNLSTFSKLISGIPGPAKMDISEVFGGMPPEVPDLIRQRPAKHKILKTLALVLLSPFLLLLFLLLVRKKNSDRFLKVMYSTSETMQSADYSKLTMEELVKGVYWYDIWRRKVFTVVACISAGMGYTTAFFRICKRWLKDDNSKIGNLLLTGVGNMASADSGRELIYLAAWVEKNEKLKEVVIEAETFEVLRRELIKIDGGVAFLKKWNLFMHLHGHHARGEIDIFITRWSEQPDYILRMLKGYIGKTADFITLQEEKDKLRKKVLEETLKYLKNPFKRAVFKFLMNRARRGLSLRENTKSGIVRLFSGVRKSLKEIETRWINKGILKEKDDIFYITIDEFDEIYKGKVSEGLEQRIVERRKEFQENLDIVPPAVVIGAFDPKKTYDTVIHATESDWKGIAVCPGVVKGVARVIMSCQSDERLLPGEILVAPFTDPGWTPYFLNAAGIVMDMGGMLSHGSIVAREYGIPAVVNVGPATKHINSGQMLEVDGNRGIVSVIEKLC